MKAVLRAGTIGEQVASEILVEVTILAVLFCGYAVRYCITDLFCLDF